MWLNASFFFPLSQHLARLGTHRVESCTMRSALITLLLPIGSHPNGSVVSRNGDSHCRRVYRALGTEIPGWLPSARLRFGHQYTARRSVHLLFTGSIDSIFPARGPPHFPPDMTNAMIRSMMEACIMRRRVGNSRLFASSPESRNEANRVIGRSSVHGCVGPQSGACARNEVDGLVSQQQMVRRIISKSREPFLRL